MAKKSCSIEVYFPDEDLSLFVIEPCWEDAGFTKLCLRREHSYTFESKRLAKLFVRKLQPTFYRGICFIDDLPF